MKENTPHERHTVTTQTTPAEVDVSNPEALQVWEEMVNEYGFDAAAAYVENMGETPDSLEDFEEAYNGTWDTEEDFARELITDIGYLPDDMPALIEDNIDWRGIAADLFMYDYWSEKSGYRVMVFRNI